MEAYEPIELLAPAGDWDCIKAAVANGANAVFFGVDKFNARVRAQNFTMEDLPNVMSFLHMYGVKGFVTFNILVFEDELQDAKRLVEACIDAGVDALIVQDLGLVKLIREISPDFPIHGSTQMTITSPEAVEFTKPWDIERVVLGRENNLKQIQKIGEQAKLPMEVFVHGALCVSYSGQCLTSEMWGGRSANRGECAQACRLPYDLIVDDVHKPMGDVTYLLSPKDLAAIEIVPELIEAGVTSFKIEGRLKTPEYVANVVSKYRQAIDRYVAGNKAKPSKNDMRELQQSFSRGFTYGFLKGTNNKTLLDGTFPKSRGVFLGVVEKVTAEGAICKLEAPLKRGDGIVYDAGDPTKKEVGGRVYDLFQNGKKLDGEATEGERITIMLSRSQVDVRRIHVGDKIWKTNDPKLDKRLRETFETDKPYHTFPLYVHVGGAEGAPLVATWTDIQTGASITVQSESMLEQAIKRPLNDETLLEQFGRTGGSIYYVHEVNNELKGDVIVPLRALNQMRREAVEQLTTLRQQPPKYTKHSVEVYADAAHEQQTPPKPQLTVLCRTLEQVEATVQTDVEWIYADFEFIKQFPAAVKCVRDAGKKIALATPRIHMPGETGYFNNILKLEPDAVLIRNTGALYYFMKKKMETGSSPLLFGDFSLNIANHKAVDLFLQSGLDQYTPSYDLNIQQMMDLLEKSNTTPCEVVIHQHLPMFHTEHCVYCTFLSEGTDYTNCGRPCEEHRASLQDRIGMSHPVRVDEGCRNTVYNAIEQSGAEYLKHFIQHGVGSYRVEFLEEKADKVHEVIELYTKALQGDISGTQVWKQLKATNQLGVTRGQLVKK
ncbi:U32 family peptidase [Longirhabdus pacifica]|uniref:U32 family peptidase n=1 Tax=Longirhabdus pacifica TaxID=2305227 RepID=UPI00197F92B3|nr:U32 family peptidase [Longirhabdus pacifica]